MKYNPILSPAILNLFRRTLIAAAMLTGSIAFAGEKARLPSPILSAYGGYHLLNSDLDTVIRDWLDPMSEAGFNTVDLKIQPWRMDLSDERQYESLRALAEACRERNLALILYVYPINRFGERDPEEDAHTVPFVTEAGRVVEDRYSLIHWEPWEIMLDGAFQLAGVSAELGIPAVRIDLERTVNRAPSYDDVIWARFAAEHDVDPDTERTGRKAELEGRNLLERYEEWFFGQYREIAARFQERMLEKNPNLTLGLMPARLQDRFMAPWVEVMGTPELPAIMDTWDMYQGTGFTPRIVERREAFLEANPNILYVPWFAPNQFHPGQITHQAFHAAMMADGYSLWVLSMFTPGQDRAYLQLPHGYEPDDYWAAFGEANSMIREALETGSPRPEEIEFVEVDRLAPAIDLSEVRIPDLVPAGSGEGEPEWMRLRNYQVVYLWAEAGEPIRYELRHRIRNRLIQYYLLDPDGNELHNEIILPGGRQDLTIPAPRTGLHAFVVSSGTEAGAIYDLRFPNTRHLGVATDQPPLHYAYPFSSDQTYYVARSGGNSPASIRVRMGPRQVGRIVVNGEHEAVGETGDVIEVAIPADREVHEVRFRPPEEPWENRYTADFRVTLHGAVERLLFKNPEQRLRARE